MMPFAENFHNMKHGVSTWISENGPQTIDHIWAVVCGPPSRGEGNPVI
jgi:hypothetical protein